MATTKTFYRAAKFQVATNRGIGEHGKTIHNGERTAGPLHDPPRIERQILLVPDGQDDRRRVAQDGSEIRLHANVGHPLLVSEKARTGLARSRVRLLVF